MYALYIHFNTHTHLFNTKNLRCCYLFGRPPAESGNQEPFRDEFTHFPHPMTGWFFPLRFSLTVSLFALAQVSWLVGSWAGYNGFFPWSREGELVNFTKLLMEEYDIWIWLNMYKYIYCIYILYIYNYTYNGDIMSYIYIHILYDIISPQIRAEINHAEWRSENNTPMDPTMEPATHPPTIRHEKMTHIGSESQRSCPSFIEVTL